MTDAWPTPDAQKLATWISERTGLDLTTPDRSAAARALASELEGGARALQLLARIDRDPTAADDLFDRLTVGETFFFRQPAQFELIREEILPVLNPKPPRPLRLWSAGCATGEEAYSLAITAHEAGRQAYTIGTDLSQVRLSAARRGRYGPWSLRGLPVETIDRHFHREGINFVLNGSLRSLVEFRRLNLVEDTFPSAPARIWGMDLILCRNVLIYLQRAAVKEVVHKLVESLDENGWLLLGASDPLISDLVEVDVVVTRAGLAYRRRLRSGVPTLPADERAGVGGRHARGSPNTPAPTAPRNDSGAVIHSWTGAAASGSAPVAAASPPQAERAPSSDGEAAVATPPGPELALARELAGRGDLVEAARVCAAALESRPDSKELHHLHGLLLLASGRPDEAVLAARRALYLDSDFAAAQVLMGDARLRKGERSAARRAFQRAHALVHLLPPDDEVPGTEELAGRFLRMLDERLQLLAES